MKLLVISGLLTILVSLASSEVFLKLDVTPEEAQQYLNNINFDLGYADKTGENPVPTTRNLEGKTVYQGRVLEHPEDYVEEHYVAKQYHGQDGLGAYKYGYTDWNQAKAEDKDRNGKVTGEYKYNNAYGRDFHAKYWADSSGFHQEDNLPKVVPKPVDFTPALKKARAEHLRVWLEAARATGVEPDQNRLKAYSEKVSDVNEQPETRILPSYDTSEGSEGQYEPKTYWEPDPNEPTSEPRGFFYKFDYPVQLLRNIQEREELARRAQTPIDEIDKRPEEEEVVE